MESTGPEQALPDDLIKLSQRRAIACGGHAVLVIFGQALMFWLQLGFSELVFLWAALALAWLAIWLPQLWRRKSRYLTTAIGLFVMVPVLLFDLYAAALSPPYEIAKDLPGFGHPWNP
jgi:hypothetical protein